MRLSANKTINKTAYDLIKKGWLYRHTGSHVVIKDPITGFSIPVPSSPSCGRAEKNWLKAVDKILRGVKP